MQATTFTIEGAKAANKNVLTGALIPTTVFKLILCFLFFWMKSKLTRSFIYSFMRAEVFTKTHGCLFIISLEKLSTNFGLKTGSCMKIFHQGEIKLQSVMRLWAYENYRYGNFRGHASTCSICLWLPGIMSKSWLIGWQQGSTLAPSIDLLPPRKIAVLWSYYRGNKMCECISSTGFRTIGEGNW